MTVTNDERERFETLYGSWSKEQLRAYLTARQTRANARACEVFTLTAHVYRRFGRVPDLEPGIVDIWAGLGLDLALVGQVSSRQRPQ